MLMHTAGHLVSHASVLKYKAAETSCCFVPHFTFFRFLQRPFFFVVLSSFLSPFLLLSRFASS